MNGPTISLQNLTKFYDGQTEPALENVSLEINKGEIYGYLGPNGAGKSTTIRILMGFLQPTKGKSTVLGHDCWSDGVTSRAKVSYLSGDFVAYPKMKGGQLLDYLSSLNKRVDKRLIGKLVKKFDVELDKPIGSLSKGNRQKIGIIQVLMSKPEILILDEPTSGLDPLMQDAFYEELFDAKKRGASVFMSSHNLLEVQKMCDRVGIIRSGKLVHETDIKSLEINAAQLFEITFTGKPPISALKSLPGTNVSVHANKVTLQIVGDLGPLFTVLSKEKVSQITTRELNLEDEFMQFYVSGSAK